MHNYELTLRDIYGCAHFQRGNGYSTKYEAERAESYAIELAVGYNLVIENSIIIKE